MAEEINKSKEMDEIYQKAQAMVSNLGNQQRGRAISYIKRIEEKKIAELRREVISES